VRFKKFLEAGKVDFDKINRALMESLRDEAFHKSNKKGINKNLLKTDEQLEKEGFFKKYPHLAE
jgi:hypothetical protein